MPPNFLLLLTKIQWFHFPATAELFLHSTAASRKPCLHPRHSPLCSLQLLLAMWVSIQTLASAAWDFAESLGPHQCLGPQKFIQTVYREVWKHQGFKTYRGNPQLIRDRHWWINTPGFLTPWKDNSELCSVQCPWESQENPNPGGNSLTACLFPHSVTCASWDQLPNKLPALQFLFQCLILGGLSKSGWMQKNKSKDYSF